MIFRSLHTHSGGACTHNVARHNSKAGKAAFWLSMVCLVHCLAMPLALAMLPAFCGEFFAHNPVLELSLLGSCILLCGWQLVRDYKMHHKRPGALVLMTIGLIIIGLLHVTEYEQAAGVAGAFTFGGSTLMNHRLIHLALAA